MAAHTKLWFGYFQQLDRRDARFLSIRAAYENIRTRQVPPSLGGMRRVAFRATDVIAPMLTPPEVVVLFSAGMAAKARLRGFFRRLVFEGNDFRRITFFNVRSSRPMTRFASSYLPFPTANGGELSMGSMREGFELILVAFLTSFAADIIASLVDRFFGLIRLGGLR
jgi:CDP-diglyceride synthetase